MGHPQGGGNYRAIFDQLDDITEDALNLKTENEKLRLENEKLLAQKHGHFTKEEMVQARKILAMFEFYNEVERENDDRD
jgi:regulator of replication initiation timing